MIYYFIGPGLKTQCSFFDILVGEKVFVVDRMELVLGLKPQRQIVNVLVSGVYLVRLCDIYTFHVLNTRDKLLLGIYNLRNELALL